MEVPLDGSAHLVYNILTRRPDACAVTSQRTVIAMNTRHRVGPHEPAVTCVTARGGLR